jgi:hypothetical protein
MTKMKLAAEFYLSLQSIRWFSSVGVEASPSVGVGTRHVRSRSEAVAGFSSDVWASAKTEAQGDLTGYLAKSRYELYGENWNRLAKESRALVEGTSRDAIVAGLAAAGLPLDWVDAVSLDINRAAVEVAFGREVRGVPRFFSRLLRIYEAGRIPCGWTRDLAEWPVGNICVY